MWLEIEKLDIQTNDKIIFEDAHLKVEHKIIVISGSNGIGKSTLFNAMYKKLDYRGSIKFMGQEVRSLSKRKLTKMISYAPQESKLLNEWTIAQNMSALHSDSKRFNFFFSQFIIKDTEKKTIMELSGGECQVVSICFALSKASEIVLLDEPFNNLSENNKSILQNIIDKDERKFMIISHQSLDIEDVLQVRVKGRVIYA